MELLVREIRRIPYRMCLCTQCLPKIYDFDVVALACRVMKSRKIHPKVASPSLDREIRPIPYPFKFVRVAKRVPKRRAQ